MNKQTFITWYIYFSFLISFNIFLHFLNNEQTRFFWFLNWFLIGIIIGITYVYQLHENRRFLYNSLEKSVKERRR